MYKFNEVANYILESDYLLENENPEQMFMRVSKKIASVEKTEELIQYWTNRFYNTIVEGYWMPATPFLMNAGVNNMLSSCFVVGGLKDDLHSIFYTNERSAIITKMGGGIGLNISKLREKDAKIVSTKGKSTGPISFMKVFNTTLDVVMQARRRGAGIIVMDIYHSDIESFITVKSDHNEIKNFNISVLVDDNFMQAVKENKNIELKSPLGYVTKVINAKELFDKIVTNARYHSEPGIIFRSAVNKDNPCLKVLGEIDSCNACVTGDTLVLTDKGYSRIDSILDKEINVWNGTEFSKVIPAITNTNQEILLIKFSDGSELKCTPYHKFHVKSNLGRECYTNKVLIKDAKDLEINDKLDKYSFPVIEGEKQLDNKFMYTLGVYAGDGFYNTEKNWQCISLYDVKKDLLKYIDCLNSRDEEKSDRIHVRLSNDYKSFSKEFVPDQNYSIENRLHWLAGIIDTDGTLNSKDGAIAITSIDRNFLNDIKMMLNTLGCNATLSLNKKATKKEMPFGENDTKEYQCQDCFRLIINASNAFKLMQLQLHTNRVELIANPNRNASKFIYVTEIIKQPNIEEFVYCFNEPIKHKGCFNGIVTGQCGEIPLYEDEACNLASHNLQKYIDMDGKFDFEKLDYVTETIVRFLDNSIDINNLPDDTIKKAVLLTRKLGIGVMGLNPMLTKKGLSYDSKEGRIFAKSVMKRITDTAQKYSCQLIDEGRELPEAWYGSTFEEQGIKIRNLSVTSGQPTGATQILLDEECASSGVETYFAIVFRRLMREKEYIMVNSLFRDIGNSEGWLNDNIIKEILDNSGSCQGIKGVPEKWQKLFKTSLEISWEDHIKMQAELQQVTTNALSKTINMSQNSTVEDVYKAFMMAWELGCKGTTVYVQNSRENQVLSAESPIEVNKYVPINETLDIANSVRLKVKTGCGSMWLFLIYNEDGKLCEVFSQSGSSGGCQGMTIALTRMISTMLKANVDPYVIIEQLQSVKCDVSVAAHKKDEEVGKSCGDGIAKQMIKFLNGELKPSKDIIIQTVKPLQIEFNQDEKFKCPECGEYTLTKYDGCVQCTKCTYQKCH